MGLDGFGVQGTVQVGGTRIWRQGSGCGAPPYGVHKYMLLQVPKQRGPEMPPIHDSKIATTVKCLDWFYFAMKMLMIPGHLEVRS